MIDVRVPDEQEGTKAVVRAWLKKVGEAVAVNDPLVELETDKVTQEVPSPAAGVLSEIVLETDAEARRRPGPRRRSLLQAFRKKRLTPLRGPGLRRGTGKRASLPR